MPIGHGVRSAQVRGRRCAAGLELIRLVPFEVVDFVAVAIHNHGPRGSQDGRAAVASVTLHSLAARPFPGEHFVFVHEARHQRVIELPVVFEVISAAGRGDPFWIIHAQRPPAHIHFVRSIVQRFAGAIGSEPVPVVRV